MFVLVWAVASFSAVTFHMRLAVLPTYRRECRAIPHSCKAAWSSLSWPPQRLSGSNELISARFVLLPVCAPCVFAVRVFPCAVAVFRLRSPLPPRDFHRLVFWIRFGLSFLLLRILISSSFIATVDLFWISLRGFLSVDFQTLPFPDGDRALDLSLI